MKVVRLFIQFDEINNYQSAWILKLDNQRNIIWQNLFQIGYLTKIIVKSASDSGFIVLAGNKFLKFNKKNNEEFRIYSICSCYLIYINEFSNGDYLVVGLTYKNFFVARIS